MFVNRRNWPFQNLIIEKDHLKEKRNHPTILREILNLTLRILYLVIDVK